MTTPHDSGGAFTRRYWLKTAALATAAAGTGVLSRAASDASKTKELSDAQRAALRGVLEETVAKKAAPGASLAVLAGGRVVFREAVGRMDFEGERPFTVDAPCSIASVSKPISATFMVMLDERGIVKLDDPVEKYLPEFRGVRVQKQGEAKTTMRVWHLLSHRSGLPGNADMGDARPHRAAREVNGKTEELDTTLAQVTNRWIKEGLLAEPGERFAYGSAGYMVAARIAEVVMGKRYEVLLNENLLGPLGMKHTTFHPDAATIAAMPARYQPTPKGPQHDTRTMPLPVADGLINPAGGLISRLDDIGAFLALHANRGMAGGKRLVKAESLERMYRPHPPKATEAADGGGAGYGLGWNVMAPGGAARHLGASGTMVWIDLRKGHAGVLLTQVKWGAAKPIIPRLMREVQTVFGA
ncbi:MAG: serine hydrolase domain-containing protein [Verrucomicrobiota bacterium]